MSDTINMSTLIVKTNKDDPGTTFAITDRQAREDIADITNYINRSRRAINDGGKIQKQAMISFTDDDCRLEAYTLLYEQVLKDDLTGDIKIPYTFACPPGNIDDPNATKDFMTSTQIKEVHDNGISISCHHWRQYNMNDTSQSQFPTADAYDADLQKCQAKFKEWGINDVISVSYPQGKYLDEYIPIAKKHYRMGYTVDRDINHIPYESFYMHRCEVFANTTTVPTESVEITYQDSDGVSVTETVVIPSEAKGYVDRLVIEGGWLIFMTHAWYQNFSVDQLKGLIKYIQSLGIEIVDTNVAIETTGNIIDVGIFRKPLEDKTESFFVVDSTGTVWANSLNIFDRYTVVTPSKWSTGARVSSSGKVRSDETKTYCMLSKALEVKAGEVYSLTCSARYGWALYAIGTLEDESELFKSNITLFDDAEAVKVSSTAEAGAVEGDTILTDYKVTIPADGYIYVAADTEIQPDGFVIKKRV